MRFSLLLQDVFCDAAAKSWFIYLIQPALLESGESLSGSNSGEQRGVRGHHRSNNVGELHTSNSRERQEGTLGGGWVEGSTYRKRAHCIISLSMRACPHLSRFFVEKGVETTGTARVSRQRGTIVTSQPTTALRNGRKEASRSSRRRRGCGQKEEYISIVSLPAC